MKQTKIRNIFKVIWVFFFLTAFSSMQAAASDETAVSPGFFPAFIRMICVLCIVVGIIILLSYVFRKFNFQGHFMLNAKKYMEVADTLYLGQKKSVTLLKVGKEFFLLGVSNNGINFLSKIEPDPECSAFSDQDKKKGKFSAVLDEKCRSQSALSFADNNCFNFENVQNFIRNTFSHFLHRSSDLGKAIKRGTE